MEKEFLQERWAGGAEGLEAVWQAHQQELAQLEQEYTKKLDRLRFDSRLDQQITAAHGRNLKAIRALLDLDVLEGQSPEEAGRAIRSLQAQCPYLFDTLTPPPYARGTGSGPVSPEQGPGTLAGAIREKFERN